MREGKLRSSAEPNFLFLNHNSTQEQMIHALFILINLVLNALKLLKMGKFTLFMCPFTCRVYVEPRKVITFRVLMWEVKLRSSVEPNLFLLKIPALPKNK